MSILIASESVPLDTTDMKTPRESYFLTVPLFSSIKMFPNESILISTGFEMLSINVLTTRVELSVFCILLLL